jgi:iron complex outermembrane receptor protein
MTEFNKKRNFLRLRATWLEYGDYKVPADTFLYNTYVLPIYNQRLKNTAGKELNFSASGGIMRDWGMMRLTFSSYNQQAGLFPGATGIPRAYTLTEDGDYRNIDLPRQVNHHYKVLYNINIRRKKGWFETDLGYQYNLRMEQSKPHAHGYTPLTLSDTALYLGLQTFSFNTRLHHQPVPRFKSVIGISGQHMDNTKGGFEFLIPNYRSTSAGAYYFMQVYLNEDFTISAGLRGDAAHLKMDGWDQPNYDVNGEIIGYTHRSPVLDKWYANVSGAAGFSWEIKHEFNIKLNIGRSFRTPTPAELGANGIHHGTFRHEMGDSTLRSEIGYQSDLAFIYHDEHYLIRFTPFYNYFDNYIFLRPAAEFSPLPDAGQIYRYTQARAIHTGFELYGEYHIIPELHLETGLEYVWNMNLDTWLPLPFTPPGSAMLGVEWEKEREKKKFDSWFIGADAFYYLAQNRVDRNEKTTPGYFLLAASVGAHVKLHKNFAFDLLLKANNLLNTEYMNHLSRYRLLNLPEQGRNFSIMLRMNF